MDTPKTIVLPDTSRSVISRNKSPDIGFDLSINPYRGCEHGCVYCYARPSHAFLGLSPGLDFETRLFAKFDAAERLEEELSEARYRPDTIVIGANTDAYQPVEREHGITRSLLEVLDRYRNPVALITKSSLVTRDIDILSRMAERRQAFMTISVTSLDRGLARAMEPRASTPGKRLDAIRTLSAAGIPVGVNIAPVIPGLNDHEMEAILQKAAEAGATSAGYILLRLPLEIAGLFEEWLETHRPDRKARVLDLVRQTRGGALYRAKFGERMKGTGPYAELIAKRYAMALRKNALAKRSYELDATLFSRPLARGRQLGLDL